MVLGLLSGDKAAGSWSSD